MTIVLVGHCGPDMAMLTSAISRAVPGATIMRANDDATLAPYLAPGCALIVNRVLDGSFDASDGIDLIRRVSEGENAPTALLVSNYPEAQRDAEAAGAMPGFGKSELYDKETADRIRATLPD